MSDCTRLSSPRPSLGWRTAERLCVGIGHRYERTMQRWSRLNERQLALLTRVGEGVDPVTSDNPDLALSARALKERGLITMPKAEGKKWQAEITGAGTFYLEHGHHPDLPEKRPRIAAAASVLSSSEREAAASSVSGDTVQVKGPAPATDTSTPLKPTRSARGNGEVGGPALIEKVRAAGRFLRIPDPDPEERARYRRAFDAARTCAPAGYHLKYSGRAKGDFFLGLLRVTGEDDTEWNRIRLQRSKTITDVDEVIAAVRADHSAFEISDDVLPRVLSLIRLLAEGALSRHGDIAVSKKRRRPRPMLTVHGRTYELSFLEKQKQVRYVPPRKRQRRTYDWQRATPEYRSEPSGELELHLSQGHNSKLNWSDTAAKALEAQVETIFRALKRHAEEQERARLEREAEYQRQRAEWERREVERKQAEVDERERRQQEWETALAEARTAAAKAARGDRFAAALDGWRMAAEIRTFCTALDEAAARADEPAEAERLRQWSQWGDEQADSLEATAEGGLAKAEFNSDLSGDELRPFLNGWSPHRPEKEKPPAQLPPQRAEPETRRDFTDARLDQGWRYGRPGRAQWWRR